MGDRAGSVRIVTADDHAVFRDSLRKLLLAQPGLEVVGEAADGIEAIDLVGRHTPDVLLLDLLMPRMGGLDVLRGLAHQSGRVRTILLTAAIGGHDIVTALRLGARGVVLKAAASELIHQAIATVMSGEMWIGREQAGGLEEAMKRIKRPPLRAAECIASLTPREREVFAALVQGASNRDVAAILGISEQTVKNHISNILAKCGVSTRAELEALAADLRDFGGLADSATQAPGDFFSAQK